MWLAGRLVLRRAGHVAGRTSGAKEDGACGWQDVLC